MKIAVNRFALKHGIDYIRHIETDIHEFSGGVILTENEIKKDLELDLPVGIIELYHEESRDGHVRDFEAWLLKHYPVCQTNSKEAM